MLEGLGPAAHHAVPSLLGEIRGKRKSAAAAVAALQAIVPEADRRLFPAIRDLYDPRTELSGVADLSDLGASAAIALPDLLARASSSREYIRITLEKPLRRLGPPLPECVPLLVQMALGTTPDGEKAPANIRLRAIGYLGQVQSKDSDAISGLVELLFDNDLGDRTADALYKAGLKDKQTIGRIGEMLTGLVPVRRRAAYVLSGVGGNAAARPVGSGRRTQ